MPHVMILLVQVVTLFTTSSYVKPFSIHISLLGSRKMSTAQEERQWNRLGASMKSFHDHFKHEFNQTFELADGSFSKRGMSFQRYLMNTNDFVKHLTMHHTIEERFIFPVLSKRMPSFQNDEVHLKSHEGIHVGLDKLSALLQKWHADPSTYSPEDMKTCLDSWREVLFKHLDEEVNDLSGENMKKYWKLEELNQIPM